ncbi:MAG: DEAD/DEAH box helicase [Chitinophagales bacterium]
MKNSSNNYQEILQNLGITALNDMQNATIEASQKDQDIMLRSPTGTGKTLAFLLPVFSHLKPRSKVVQAVVLVPTRELALQVTSVVKDMKIPYKVTCCYGGHPVRLEKQSLKNPPAILVATPGRLSDHIRRDHIDISQAKMLVLDEFDKSLAFGFQNQMGYIIEEMPLIRKRILTSATESLTIPSFVGLQNPIKLQFEGEEQKPQIELKLVKSPSKDKLETLYQLICNLGDTSMLIFCNFRETVERVSGFLKKQGIVHDYFHGGLEQIDREKKLLKFRNGTYKILVSTDVTARGIDIPEIDYIVHYHLAPKEDIFVHRNGRTARMHATGTVFLLQSVQERLPDYMNEEPEIFELKENQPPPPKPQWKTLSINKGKKEKVGKGDVVGFLIKIGGLEKDDIGIIEVKHFFALVAVKSSKIEKVARKVNNQKIKGKKVRVWVDE